MSVDIVKDEVKKEQFNTKNYKNTNWTINQELMKSIFWHGGDTVS